MTLYWKKQKLLATLKFRRLPEEEIDLVLSNLQHTYVYEILMEDDSVITSEDGLNAFMTEAS
ncbi:MAG: hypothetical protein ABGY11_09425 [Candidatus Thioglobus sp.]